MMNPAVLSKYVKTNKKILTADSIFHFCCWLYFVSFAILPDWFGFYVGMLFSAKRIMLLVCYCFILFSKKRLNIFIKDLTTYKMPNILIALYMFVKLYTAIYRFNLQTFANEFLDGVLVFYLFAYIIKHEIKCESLLKFLKIVLIILCLEGLFEYATGINLFSYLDTTHQFSTTANVRGGSLRIQANCHHAIHYGIYVSILFFLSCYDPKKKKTYLLRNPLLFILSIVCIYLSGSRAPLGIFLLCSVILCLFSGKDNLIKSVVFLLCIVAVFLLFLIFAYNTSIGESSMQMLAAMIDGFFDTTLVADYFDPTLAQTYAWSAEYRDALYKVFQLDYFNMLVGRGNAYHLSVVIDGYWLQSCDNSYVMIYIQTAYPGLITFIALCLSFAGMMLKGALKNKDKLLSVAFVACLCYYINIWYVAQMGTFMYVWMIFAMSYLANQNLENKTKGEYLCRLKR